jgi:ribosomal-protein-alanine N-acetyltransferase
MPRIVPLRRVPVQQLADIRQRCLPSDGWRASDFAFLLKEPAYGGFAIALGQPSKVIGFIDWRIVGDEAEIYAFCVLPEHRKKGFGQKLLKVLLEEAYKRGIKKVFLEVSEENFVGKHLYRIFGFREIGRRYGYYTRAPDGGKTAIVLCATPADFSKGKDTSSRLRRHFP